MVAISLDPSRCLCSIKTISPINKTNNQLLYTNTCYIACNYLVELEPHLLDNDKRPTRGHATLTRIEHSPFSHAQAPLNKHASIL